MADPVYTLAVEFVAGSFTTVTSDCLKVSIARDSANLQSPVSEGRMMVIMDNHNKKYSPRNTAGPYYPNIKPNKNIKLTATYAGSTYNLFYGQVTQIQVDPNIQRESVFLECGDLVHKLRTRTVNIGTTLDTNPGSLFVDILSASGVSSYTLGAFGESLPYAWLDEQQSRSALNRLIKFGHYWLWNSGDGDTHIAHRYFNDVASLDTVVSSYSDSIGYWDLQETTNADTVINNIKVSAEPRQIETSQSTISWIQGPVTIPASDYKSFWLSFIDPVTLIDGTPATNVVTPVAGSDYVATTQPQGAGAVITSNISMRIGIFGATSVVTLFNGNGVTAHINKFQIRGTPITKKPRFKATAQDSSSISIHGERDLTIDDDFISNETYAQAYADFLLNRYKTERPSPTFALKHTFPDVLIREIGDILRLSNDNTGIDGEFFISSITHTINLRGGLEHSVKCNTEQVDKEKYLVLGDSLAGTIDTDRILA